MNKTKRWVLALVVLSLVAIALGVNGYLAAQDDLPLVELPASASQDDRLAVILSGDGGWADLDKWFGADFQKRGIATLGINCLRYFWKKRTPDEVSAALEETLRHYLDTWQKQRLLLIGYSFGANWLPFLVNRLPDDLKSRVTLVVLLSPGQYANLEIQMGDWMRSNIHRPGALSTQDEASQIALPTLCVWGKQDPEPTICPALSGKNVRKLPKKGGHHYDGNYASIENVILSSLP